MLDVLLGTESSTEQAKVAVSNANPYLHFYLRLWIRLLRPIHHACRSTDRELPSCKPRIGCASINVRKSWFHFRRERREPFAAPRTQLPGCQSIRLVTPFTIGCANDF
ncbi:PREDICTED: uncharacterized protein LOC105568140 isoform X1 [Vollenhovia emeryi]|uniref:uncharacterized protein LOC105568140 isoform X1 n=1 Tax=Vollenhovia emeryi TaxID=411798 RepID=UPI0005F456C5|nr:PREDICTED: uncharacterized protein LOC105568140 isoform X1 [Vollenhovia emeryi]